jgi:hypothetical protein
MMLVSAFLCDHRLYEDTETLPITTTLRIHEVEE